MKLFIKNMVCPRCIEAVNNVLQESGIPVSSIMLGEVITLEELTDSTRALLTENLKQKGFELIDNRNGQVITKVKNLIVQQVHYAQNQMNTNWSQYISDHLNLQYKYLSRLFSSLEGITIEQYIIRQKTEKAKELIRYNQMSLSQIANQLGYSSVAHLSGQFKKVTGMNPSDFKEMGSRIPLDQV